MSEPHRRQWVDRELAVSGIVVQYGRSIEDLVAALVEDPPPRPQVLVADLEQATPEELDRIASVRQQGWFGALFTVGRTSMKVRRDLQVERVFVAPFDDLALRGSIAGMSHDAQTLRMSRICG